MDASITRPAAACENLGPIIDPQRHVGAAAHANGFVYDDENQTITLHEAPD